MKTLLPLQPLPAPLHTYRPHGAWRWGSLKALTDRVKAHGAPQRLKPLPEGYEPLWVSCPQQVSERVSLALAYYLEDRPCSNPHRPTSFPVHYWAGDLWRTLWASGSFDQYDLAHALHLQGVKVQAVGGG